ncbi:allophanate hydrolase subunit 2 [Streptosporangium becharense]|uniref:Allophanate hydrolase subunit 2 n=1 Tax=Streptosporangium becharense TaxID=1816182 RepID=A0A7W9IK23_9ACTN|nr:biotin-dependent carboxyltransferase family protein [Streptosporangium becharense]MBB2913201.1 allophanate hydrolase subunit 2 [Streptosporangium becharense]MBB5822184.1 allophanate hydrolase subunit 2 [Streptosporangium becharense]
MIEVIAPGPYATVQDLGRPGYAHLGVPRSGAADTPSLRLANRLVGNPEGVAGVELTFGGARLRFTAGAWVAVTGAACRVTLARTGGTDAGADPGTGAGTGAGVGAPGMYAPFWVPAGGELRMGTPSSGLRTYLAVRGGVDVPATMGSRSTDSLSGLGPAPLRAGSRLPVGPTGALPPITVDAAPQPAPVPDVPSVLRVLPGPRDDWFAPGALAVLCGGPYEVGQDSNRVGVRLSGAALERARPGELPSEGMVAGAVQVPPGGQPIVFLADHPPTGGYPVIAVLTSASLAGAAQLRPGDRVRFRL